MRNDARDQSGFTLVELLVVIAIIATLAGLITASVQVARKSATKKRCGMIIQEISAGLGNYLSDFGDYPPSDPERFYSGQYDVTFNGLNDGTESLVAHLGTQRKGGPYFEFKDDHLENLDQDTLANEDLFVDLDWMFGDRQLREFVDPWGNALVYIHNRRYEEGPYRVQNAEKKEMVVSAARSEKTGSFQGLTTFQIWSVGPNGVNDGGAGDDIVSW